MTRPAPDELLPHLGLAVLERRAGGGFVPFGTIPGWMEALVAPLRDGRGASGEDVLSHAAAEAERAWDEDRPGASEVVGPWIEHDADGAERAIEATSTILGGRRLLVLRDVTREHAHVREILQAGREALLDRERLVREQQTRDLLLHCIVHDLGGPLTSLRASLQMLGDVDVPIEERAELLAIAVRSVDRQHELVHEILGAFKAELRSLSSQGEGGSPSLAEVAEQVVTALRPPAREAGVGLRLEGCEPPAEGWCCVGERSRLERVVTNLVENALRHSPQGRDVVVRLDAGDGAAELSVLDEGGGVPQGAIDQLFRRGRQGQSPGKAGLGLFFCRQTIERWGGSIGYAAREDAGGARFWVRLPLVGEARAAARRWS